MATLYVDYKNGNDAGTGATGDPLKTLAHTLSAHAGNNDTILCRGSDATDEIYQEYGFATALTGLTIAADTGHTPTWTPATAYTSWALTAGQSFTYETAFTPAACWYCLNGSTSLLVKASIAEVEATENTFYADVAGDKLYVHIAGGGAPTSIRAWSSVDGLLTSAGANITYSGLRCQWCGCGFAINAAATVTNCTVRYHGGAYFGSRNCIQITTSSAVVISGCTISGQLGTVNGSRGIYLDLANAVVSISNTVFSDLFTGIRDNATATVTVDSCTMSNIIDGVTLYKALAGSVIRYCTFSNFGHGAVQLAETTNAVVHHNIAYFAGSNTHHNTYICETGATGLFYHNVAYGLESASGNGFGFYIKENASTATVYNNIAQDCKIGYHQDATPTLTTDYNCAYGCAVAYQDWVEGAHGITDDPEFVDAANADFHLSATSPCLDTGVAIAGINDGYCGTAPDIGRFEALAAALVGAWAGAGGLARAVTKPLSGAWSGAGAVARAIAKLVAGVWSGIGGMSSTNTVVADHRACLTVSDTPVLTMTASDAGACSTT